MLTLNLSFKSLPFLSTKFESCELPISPLISFPSLSPYRFCSNSILCCVFICYHHYIVIHRPCFVTYLYSCSLKKPPLFHLNLRVAVYLSGIGTYPIFFPCTSCLNSTLCGIYILGSYTHLPPLLHPCLLSPLDPRDIYSPFLSMALE
jgi:hypothetical protein